MSEASRLGVLIDGVPLGDEEARALWTEFSAHMDEHRGDMAGFAKKKGWRSVLPDYRKGRAVLVVDSGKGPAPKAPPAVKAPPAPGGKAKKRRR
jgi:hypothetical protein